MSARNIISKIAKEKNLKVLQDESSYGFFDGKTHIDLEIVNKAAKITIYISNIDETIYEKMVSITNTCGIE